MDKLHVYDVEAAGAAGVSLKNITLHRGLDGALLDGYFERDAEGRWTYSGGLRDGDNVVQVASLRMSPWAGTALDEALRRTQALPFELVSDGDTFYIDGLPMGRCPVLRCPVPPATPTHPESDLVQAHLAKHPLISGTGTTLHAAAVNLLHSLRKHAADPAGWLSACAEECAAELERIRAVGIDVSRGVIGTRDFWESLQRTYLNAVRIVEAANVASPMRAELDALRSRVRDLEEAGRDARDWLVEVIDCAFSDDPAGVDQIGLVERAHARLEAMNLGDGDPDTATAEGPTAGPPCVMVNDIRMEIPGGDAHAVPTSFVEEVQAEIERQTAEQRAGTHGAIDVMLLDFAGPPPGLRCDPFLGWPGEPQAEKDEAWALYMVGDDPPGMKVLEHEAQGWTFSLQGEALHVGIWNDEAEARSAAWDWYRRRAVLVNGFVPAEGFAGVVPTWPAVLTWPLGHVVRTEEARRG